MECIMLKDSVQLGLIAEVLGAPFLMDDPANQFLHLKRQVVHLQDFWGPDHHPDGKGISLADEVLHLTQLGLYCCLLNWHCIGWHSDVTSFASRFPF